MASMNNISNGDLYFVDGALTDLVDAETHTINKNIRPYMSHRSFIQLPCSNICPMAAQTFQELHNQTFNNAPPMPCTIVYIFDGNNSLFMDAVEGIRWLSKSFTNPNSYAHVEKVYLFIQRYFDSHFTSLAWGNNLSDEIKALCRIFSIEESDDCNRLRENYIRQILKPNTYNPDVVSLSQMLLCQNPKNDLALFALTDMCRLGLHDKELHITRLRKILEKELEADKKNVNILTCLGELYRIGGCDALPDGLSAFKLLDSASHLDAKNWRALSSLGELLRTGAKDLPPDLKKSAICLRAAHDIQPNDVAVLVSMGYLCLSGGDDLLPVEQIVKSLEEVLSHNRQNVEILSLLGEIYRRGIGVFPPNIKRAHALLEYAHRLSPKNVKVLLSLGRLYRTGGEGLFPNVKRGRSLFESAHRLNPNNVETLACLAELHRTGGQGVEPNIQLAMQYLEQAQKIDSNNATVLAMLGEFYLVGGQQVFPDILLAENFLQQAVRIEPKNVYALTTLAQLYWDGGRDIEPEALKALDCLERARKIEPNNVNVLALLGALYFTGGVNLLPNIEEARKLLEQAIQKNPYDVFSLVAIQYLYRDEGSLEKALALLKRAIHVNPYNVVAIGSSLALHRFENPTLLALPHEDKEVKERLDDKMVMKFHPHSVGILAFSGMLADVQLSLANRGFSIEMKFSSGNVSGSANSDDLFKKIDMKKVQSKLEEAVAINPYCPYALFALYSFYRNHSIPIPKRLSQAIQKTISLYKNDFHMLGALGPAFYTRSFTFDDLQVSAEEFQIAQSCLERACSLPPDNVEPKIYSNAHFLLAMLYLYRDVEKGNFAHDFKPIKEHFEMSLKYMPGNEMNWFLGEIVPTTLQENRFVRATFEHLKKVSEKNPKNGFAHIALGLVSFFGGKDQQETSLLAHQGIQHFQEALRLEPDNGFVLTQLGSINLALGEGATETTDLSMAKDFLKKAIVVDPQNPFAHYLYAMVLLKAKQLDNSAMKEIRGLLEKAYNLAPNQNHVRLMLNLARVLKMEDKNSKRADELLTKVYAKNPEFTTGFAEEFKIELPQSLFQQGAHQHMADEKKETKEANDLQLATSTVTLPDLQRLSIDDVKTKISV